MTADEKILCPYCGSEMVQGDCTFELYYVCPNCDSESPIVSPFSHTADTKDELWEYARAAALRRFQPLQQPLTLEEVLTIAIPTPIWIEFWNGRLEPRIITGIQWCGDKCYLELEYDNDSIKIPNLRTPKVERWRPWRTRPTDEERQAAGWKFP